MMKLHKISLALAVSGMMAFGVATAAPSITLNPSALNGGVAGSAPQIDILGANGRQAGPLVVTSIQTSLASLLSITAGTGNSGWTESGALVFNTYNGGNQLNGGRTLGSGGDYDIYGLFSGSGGGTWTGNQFNVTSINSFSIQIWASPETGTTTQFGTAGTIVGGGSQDFLLGTATFTGSFGGTNAQLGPGFTATTQLTAEFAFTPANAAYTGVGGYFQAPDPFIVNFNASGSSNSGQSTYAFTEVGGVLITTGNGATGNLTPLNRVPEPGALALVSIALLAGGVASLRRRSSTEA